MNVEKAYEAFEREYNKRIGALEAYNTDKAAVQTDIRNTQSELAPEKKKLILVSQTLDNFRDEYAKRYSEEVTSALSRIVEHTGYDIECEMSFSKDGKQMFIKLVNIYPNGKRVEGTPEQIHGGGFNDLTAIAFNLSYLHQKEDIQGTILYDEPTQQLSSGYSGPFYDYMRDTREELGNQIIMVTHDTSIINDARFGQHVIEVRLNSDGSSNILTGGSSSDKMDL